jgi:hypothetical protein
MLAIEFNVVVVVRMPTNSGSLTWCARLCEYEGCWWLEKLCRLWSGVVNIPTTGSCLSPRYSEKLACVGVRCECMFGVADVGVGYAVLLPYVEAVVDCGVAVGVEVGCGSEDEDFGMPKLCADELPAIGVGVECR